MKPQVHEILANVERVSGVPVEAIRGKRKTRRVVWARFLALAALNKAFPWWSQADLAEAVGREDNGTASYGLRSVARLRETEPDFEEMFREVSLKVESRKV